MWWGYLDFHGDVHDGTPPHVSVAVHFSERDPCGGKIEGGIYFMAKTSRKIMILSRVQKPQVGTPWSVMAGVFFGANA